MTLRVKNDNKNHVLLNPQVHYPSLGHFPFVTKNRSFRKKIKWNGPFHWKFPEKKDTFRGIPLSSFFLNFFFVGIIGISLCFGTLVGCSLTKYALCFPKSPVERTVLSDFSSGTTGFFHKNGKRSLSSPDLLFIGKKHLLSIYT